MLGATSSPCSFKTAFGSAISRFLKLSSAHDLATIRAHVLPGCSLPMFSSLSRKMILVQVYCTPLMSRPSAAHGRSQSCGSDTLCASAHETSLILAIGHLQTVRRYAR